MNVLNQLAKIKKAVLSIIFATALLFISQYSNSPVFAVSPSPTPGFAINEPVTAQDLEKLNPLVMFGNDPVKIDVLPAGKVSLAGLINRSLKFIFPLAGLLLFLMLVWGGFEMLTGVASKKNMDAGKQRVTAALIGFLLLFVAYWVAQMVEYVTGVVILG